MSDVLKELRNEFEEAYWVTPNRPGSALHWVDIERVLDRFAAAHPGLVDHTEPCLSCGTPTYLLQEGTDTRLASDYGTDRPGKIIGVLCPACAGKVKP